METLEITKEERDILTKLVKNYISELRMEIADTDQSSFKKGLKEEQEVLKKLLEKLGHKE
ncbi:MAG: hypothetical protein GWO07_11750 [Candidatus Dadabacteria bacterium]|nr:hypothetical protein [Candidatus Dadabacteria bacterium]NIS09412.1 hypothetical protein [Candidatus Dadabacteria bacterium]NIV42549.1 hypothetical protein [Candidatus Dadabacteria bacterium]NIY22650.1 hypothetical protein [Candidatus Dadabacteria bacterium]